MDIAALQELPRGLLAAISEGAIPESDPREWAFLDTETTGLAGGSGTVAFLVGVGRITERGFQVRQFFMREHGEEPSLLHALAAHLTQFRILITYNGRTYDQPLLETRYRLARFRPPFAALEHLDLLHGARRLWRLRFASCRLTELESQILGVEREGDLPGEMIPYVYFEYLRKREAHRLAPVFHHNAHDILTLACLTGIVPWAFQDPENAPLAHGAECASLARWLQRAGQTDSAARLLRRGIELGLPDELLWRALWDLALLERKRERPDAALALFTELSTARNPYRARAYEELAKHYEHREKNWALALEMTRAARAVEDSTERRRREQRLEKRARAKSAAGWLP
jgi:tetratricopeptide (TPR) repeat protein